MNEVELLKADVDAISRIPIINTILEVICSTTGMGFSVIARVTDDRWIACAVRDEINFGLGPGGELKVETTLCHEVHQNTCEIVIDNVAEDMVYRNHHTPAMYGLQSYISIPIILKNGDFFGTLCAIDPHPHDLNNPKVLGMFRLYADLISFHLAADEQISLAENTLAQERSATEELKSLSKTLVNLNNQLISSNKDFKSVNNKLHHAQTELRALNNEMQSANEELTAANEELLLSREDLLQANRTILEREDNLTQAINLAFIDLWSVNLQSGAVLLTNRAKEMHGLAADDELFYRTTLGFIAPEHQSVVDKTIQDAIAKLGSFTVEYKIIPKDGSKECWIKSTGQVYADAEGRPAKMQGLMADITKQKEDDQRKNDFIGMVSHEMKTPLTSLKGYIQLLQGRTKNYDDAFVGSALDKANNQIGKMTKMINGFLNVSRFESGKIHIENERFDMKDLVRDVEEETVPVNTSHTIIFKPVETSWVNGDKDKIGQVITNFISNALKYSSPGTTVQIACVTADGCAQVSVHDQGMGIAPKDLDKLFDRYYRVEGHQMKSISGFGIGLYLSSEIIERHNGKIWVESEVGKGSTFYFSIPTAE